MKTRVCSEPGCPTIYQGANSRCPAHARQADRARGTRQQRGYDSAHDRLRARWAPRVARGQVDCARCGQRIRRGQAWDLGHTDDRAGYNGPEHAQCNRAAGGRKAHQHTIPR